MISMVKRRSGRITIDIDVGEYIDEIDDEALLEAVQERKLTGLSEFDPVDDLQIVRAELLRGRPAEALSILDRLLMPKWNSRQACEIAMKTATTERLKQVKAGS
jgi:hypothetical protein